MTQVYPGLPPQYPPTAPPQFPQQPAQYPPQAAPQYPPQQFMQPQQYAVPNPYPQAPVQPPLAQGTLDDFYNQPSTGGGKSISFQGKPPGTRYRGIVTRPITSGDIQQQTAQGTNAPQFFKDGRPRLVMKVPLQMQPSAEYPDGLATWYVKGQARDELVRAMAEVGAPAGPPEAGSIIEVIFTGTRPSGPGMNPAHVVQVAYTRPNGAGPVSVPEAAVAPPQPDLAAQQLAAAQEVAAMQAAQAAQFAAAQQVQQYTPTQVASPPAQLVVPTPPAAQQAAPQPPADLSPEQQTLLAKLTGS